MTQVTVPLGSGGLGRIVGQVDMLGETERSIRVRAGDGPFNNLRHDNPAASIFQDEPVKSPGSGNTAPDGAGIGTSTASVRPEREGGGDGRVYHISFTATSATGGACTGTVTVGVPKGQGHGAPVDGGPLYDSTIP